MPDTERIITRADNAPPEIIGINDPDVLGARLARDHADMVKRFVELEISIGQIPATINDEPTAQRVVDFVAQQVRPLTDDAETKHKREKKQFLDCSRVVDRFFLDRVKQLNNSISPIYARASTYLKRKAEEQRRAEEAKRREAEAARQKAAAEAERLAAEARAQVEEGNRQAAIQLQTLAEAAQADAERAQQVILAPPAPVNIHGDYGATAFMVEKWKFEYEDLSLLPPRYWIPDEKGIQQAIDCGERNIPGLRIYRDDRFQIKRC